MILAVQLVFFGMPLGLWLRGVVLGMLTALLAVGLALVYRANRVVNFAQADLGSAPVAFAVGLIVFWGWSYWLGLGIGLVGSLVLGAVVEVALVRRFRNASRLVLTVATHRHRHAARRPGDRHAAAVGPQRGVRAHRRAVRLDVRGRRRSCSAPTT